MPITERTLKKWRKEALVRVEFLREYSEPKLHKELKIERAQRILRLTQELLDQHMLRK